MKFRQTPRRLFQFFLQGVIILAPISITIWTVVSLFNWIDHILPNIVNSLFPKLVGTDQYGNPRRFTGLGFVIVIFIVLFVGYISSSFIVSRIVHLFDRLLEKTPGIKFIYSTIKDFFEAFAGDRRKFDKSVLACIDAILERGDLRDYRLAHAARADFCRRLGRTHDARAAYTRALALTKQEPERRFLERRLAEIRP